MLENLQSGEKAATFVSTLDSGLLCLFGFGENETVQYAVQDAAGQAVDSGQSTPSNLDGDPVPSVKVMLAIGDWAPGTWYVKASASSGELNTSFTVQPKTMDGKPVLVLSLGNRQLSFAAGQSVNIAAYGLPATGTPQLGVYEVTGNSNQGRNLKLHEAVVLEPDAGAAFVTLTFDPSYQPREYCLVLQASTDYEPAGELSPLGATRCFEVTK